MHIFFKHYCSANRTRADHSRLYNTEPHNTLCYIVLAVLVIIGVLLRAHGLDRQSLWSDELFAVTLSYEPVFKNIWPALLQDSHPPGYVTFMYWTLPLSGYSDWGIRLHALLFGVLWMPLVYWITARWFSKAAALMATALVTASFVAIYYSQEARVYSFLVAMYLINMACWLELITQTQPAKKHYLGFILSSSVALYLHYSAFVVFCAQGLFYLFLLCFRNTNTSFLKAVIIFLTPLLLYAPWLGVMYKHATQSTMQWAVSPVPQPQDAYILISRLLGPGNTLTFLYLALISLGAILNIRQHFKAGLTQHVLAYYGLLFIFIVPIAVFYIKSLIATPIFETRYLIHMMPIGAILASWAFGQCIQRIEHPVYFRMILLGCLLATLLFVLHISTSWHLYTANNKDSVREATLAIRQDIAQYPDQRYTTIMSHEWFEHYLLQNQIDFPKQRELSLYVSRSRALQIKTHIEKEQFDSFYFMTVKMIPENPLAVTLQLLYQQLDYKIFRLDNSPLGIEVYKFSLMPPDPVQQNNKHILDSANHLGRWIKQRIGDYQINEYRVWMSHPWYALYLQANGIRHDEAGFDYYADFQIDAIADYFSKHPQAKDFFYVHYDEAHLKKVIPILKTRYHLEGRIAQGSDIAYHFSTRQFPSITAELIQELEALFPFQAARFIAQDIQHQKPQRYALAISRGYLENYLFAAGVSLNKSWPDYQLYHHSQIERVLEHLGKHPKLGRLYYLSFSEHDVADRLKAYWPVQCQQQQNQVQLTVFDLHSTVPTTRSAEPSSCFDTPPP